MIFILPVSHEAQAARPWTEVPVTGPEHNGSASGWEGGSQSIYT
jgi:hypothetical protein